MTGCSPDLADHLALQEAQPGPPVEPFQVGDEDLRQIIEDNFRLLALSMREVGSRTGKMETELGELRVDLTERLNSVQSLAAQNQTSFEEMAQRLESVVEAVKTLAFGDAEHRRELRALKAQMDNVVERVERLEKAG